MTRYVENPNWPSRDPEKRREVIRKSMRKRRARLKANPESPEAILETQKNRQRSSAWRKANPEKAKAQFEALDKRAPNPEKVKRRRQKFLANNRERINAEQRVVKTRRKATDPAFKMKTVLRARLSAALKSGLRGKIKKSGSTIKLLGCSMDSLLMHLESQFEPGMTWQNHGLHGWHIHHVMPCAAFDLTKDDHQRACFHFSNLKPMWAAEHMALPKFKSTHPLFADKE